MMNNEIIKIDLLISQALELQPDLDRVAEVKNFMERWKVLMLERLMARRDS